MHTQWPSTSLPNYDPLKDPVYMSDEMLQYFREKLILLQSETRQKENFTSKNTAYLVVQESDHVDQGIAEGFRYHQMAFQEHEYRLLQEIEDAIQRIDEGQYGYCEETGEAIGVRRLEATPYARYCIEIQQHKEQLNPLWR